MLLFCFALLSYIAPRSVRVWPYQRMPSFAEEDV